MSATSSVDFLPTLKGSDTAAATAALTGVLRRDSGQFSAGAVATANGGTVSRGAGRKSSITLAPLKLEAPSFTAE